MRFNNFDLVILTLELDLLFENVILANNLQTVAMGARALNEYFMRQDLPVSFNNVVLMILAIFGNAHYLEHLCSQTHLALVYVLIAYVNKK